MLPRKKHKPSAKIWIEHEGKPLIGKGGAEILTAIARDQALSKAAANLGMSYRYLWSYIRKIERTLGETVVETYKGGKVGGGGAKLTELGESVLEEYNKVEGYLNDLLSDSNLLEVIYVKISARNRLPGKVISVEKDAITAKVKVEVTVPATVTALISTEAVEDLKIRKGDKVEAIVKATEVMIAK